MSIFGQAAQPKAPAFSGFGTTTTNANSNTLFGSSTSQPAASTGGIFGAPKPPTTGIFGNTTQPATGGGIFGATSSTPSGGVFGNTGTTTTPSINTNTGSNIFGSSTNAPTSTTAPNIFGQTNTTSNPAPAQPLFGQNTQNQQQQQQQQQPQPAPTNIFGSAQQQFQPQTSSAFSAGTNSKQPQFQQFTTQGQPTPTSSFFGPRGPFTTSQLQPPKVSPEQLLQQRIEEITNAWNPTSDQCKFQHYFYNLVDPMQVSMYGRPAQATDQAKWDKAVKSNPDPTCMVPVLAVGFDDVQKRVDAQQKQAIAHQDKLKELRKSLEDLSQKHVMQNILRLQRVSVLQTQIAHRLLRFCQHLHLLIPAVRSSSIKPEEEALRSVLESVEDELRKPGGAGLGKLRGKLNELWAVVGGLQAARNRDRDRKGRDGVEWRVVDEEGLHRIANILIEEQQGLAYLTKRLQENAKDLAVLEEGTRLGTTVPPSSSTTTSSSEPSKSTNGAGYRSASGLSSSFLFGR